MAELVLDLAGTVSGVGVKTSYGEAVDIDGTKVIPVALGAYGFGVGHGASRGVVTSPLACASVYSDVEHGSPVSRAERKVLNLRPSNLIWVMPAQGGQRISNPVPLSSN